ncbi:MAG: hypothetical protein HY577_02540 [Candidatus Nealsonbacteria bacterium]|nr:hypothetical protein [Candidatus Nealsonbacteria bacterium]
MNRWICLFLLFALSACAAPTPSPAKPSTAQPTCSIALEKKEPSLSPEAQAQGIGQRWSPVSNWSAIKEEGATIVYAGEVRISFGLGGYTAQKGSQIVAVKAVAGEAVELSLSCEGATVRIFLRYDGKSWQSLEYFKKDPQA